MTAVLWLDEEHRTLRPIAIDGRPYDEGRRHELRLGMTWSLAVLLAGGISGAVLACATGLVGAVIKLVVR